MTVIDREVQLDVEPLSGSIGAVIRGLDVRDLDEETVFAIRQVWLERKVVFFPGQHLGPDDHLAFASRFGTPTEGHPVIPGIDGYPNIFEIDYTKARELYATLRRRDDSSPRDRLAHRRHVRQASAARLDSQREGDSSIGRRHDVVGPRSGASGPESLAAGLSVDACTRCTTAATRSRARSSDLARRSGTASSSKSSSPSRTPSFAGTPKRASECSSSIRALPRTSSSSIDARATCC